MLEYNNYHFRRSSKLGVHITKHLLVCNHMFNPNRKSRCSHEYYYMWLWKPLFCLFCFDTFCSNCDPDFLLFFLLNFFSFLFSTNTRFVTFFFTVIVSNRIRFWARFLNRIIVFITLSFDYVALLISSCRMLFYCYFLSTLFRSKVLNKVDASSIVFPSKLLSKC